MRKRGAADSDPPTKNRRSESLCADEAAATPDSPNSQDKQIRRQSTASHHPNQNREMTEHD